MVVVVSGRGHEDSKWHKKAIAMDSGLAVHHHLGNEPWDHAVLLDQSGGFK